jgi:hypothetical protein
VVGSSRRIQDPRPARPRPSRRSCPGDRRRRPGRAERPLMFGRVQRADKARGFRGFMISAGVGSRGRAHSPAGAEGTEGKRPAHSPLGTRTASLARAGWPGRARQPAGDAVIRRSNPAPTHPLLMGEVHKDGKSNLHVRPASACPFALVLLAAGGRGRLNMSRATRTGGPYQTGWVAWPSLASPTRRTPRCGEAPVTTGSSHGGRQEQAPARYRGRVLHVHTVSRGRRNRGSATASVGH